MATWTSKITKKVSDVASHVKRQFGDESGVQVTDDDITRWINSGQREIVSKNGLLRARSTMAATPNVYEYDFPTESILKIQSLRFKNRALEFLSFEDAEANIVKTDPNRITVADPIWWTEWAGNISVYPTPGDDGEFTLYYIKTPDEVTGVGDLLTIPDRYYETLVHYVMAQAYEMDDDWTSVSNKLQQYSANMNELSEEDASINNDLYPFISVDPEDY